MSVESAILFGDQVIHLHQSIQSARQLSGFWTAFARRVCRYHLFLPFVG